ncbi:TonB-dependent receptor [Microbulbifer litoralis]|uniref:TonB-dependent receptor n=1 Tax=Microbulbifer litoralis TaxID=2933965 RepID=UPI0020293DF2|nr:TonB-dependent receptor [Microbulbifer sp. GX H0434]
MKHHQSAAAKLACLSALLTPISCAISAQVAAQSTGSNSYAIEEVIVTASRREESLSNVAASVAVMSQEKMDVQGIQSVEDVARLTPGLNFSRQSYFSGANTEISIRGISSGVGAATTAVYIDDVPIQSRSLSFSSANVYPRTFDLQRVEVLRGPQGTLFGASAQGGAVRFITPQPSLTESSVYSRSEVAFTDGGDASYETGIAGGAPLVEDVLGIRASAWYRRDGGWVDRVSHADGSGEENANGEDARAAKVAVTWAPVPELRITPSIYYQKSEVEDTSGYWESLSDPDEGEFINGQVQAQPVDDEYMLSSVGLTYDFPDMTLISNTSYFDRDLQQVRDYTGFDSALLNPTQPYVTIDGQIATGYFSDQQENFTQEIRLQSLDSAEFEWVLGYYYSDEEQSARQRNQDYFYEQLLGNFFGLDFDAMGWSYLEDGFIYDTSFESRTKQQALFGQMDVALTDRLTFTLGARAAEFDVEHFQSGTGPWSGGDFTTDEDSSETAVTPKVGLSYQHDNDNMYYVTAAEGFRPGGGQAQVAVTTDACQAELAALGLEETPTQYDSDTVWSYEIGSKNYLFGGRMQVDANVYWIDWKDMQTSIWMNSCGSSFIDNTGEATSKGIDLALQGQVTDALNVTLSVGYTDATYDETISGGGVVIAEKGDAVFDGPQLMATLSAQQDFMFAGRDAFLRVDYSYAGEGEDANPDIYGYDPELPPVPETELVNARLGMEMNDWNLSLFVDNLTNASDGLSRFHHFQASPLFTNTSFRPRTIGFTTTYRY